RTTFVSLRAELGYVGFSRAGFEYRREARKHGQTHYNVWRMTIYAMLSILSGTTFPLRMVTYLSALVAVGFPVYVLAARVSAPRAAQLAAVLALYFVVLTLPMISL